MNQDNDYWIKGILEADKSKLKELYETCFPDVKAFFVAGGGTEDEAKRAFNEIYQMVYVKARQGKLSVGEGRFTAFYIGLCMNLLDVDNAYYVKGIFEEDKVVLDKLKALTFPAIRVYVIRNLGTANRAEDFYQNAMLKVLEKQREGKLKFEKNVPAYVVRTAQFLVNNARRKKNEDGLTIDDENTLIDETTTINATTLEAAQRQLYKKYFNKLSDKCQQLLNFFFDGISFKEIARILNYKTESAAKVMKHKCKERLIEMIKKDAGYEGLADNA